MRAKMICAKQNLYTPQQTAQTYDSLVRRFTDVMGNTDQTRGNSSSDTAKRDSSMLLVQLGGKHLMSHLTSRLIVPIKVTSWQQNVHAKTHRFTLHSSLVINPKACMATNGCGVVILSISNIRQFHHNGMPPLGVPILLV